MNAFLTDVRATVVPRRDGKDGMLPPLLVARAARRLISVTAMLLGALVGAVGVRHVHIVFPLVIALLILAAVGLTFRQGSS